MEESPQIDTNWLVEFTWEFAQVTKNNSLSLNAENLLKPTEHKAKVLRKRLENDLEPLKNYSALRVFHSGVQAKGKHVEQQKTCVLSWNRLFWEPTTFNFWES